ncbi:hypothetical protein GCK32_019078, partial [Trichostrongylus colubriformis]
MRGRAISNCYLSTSEREPFIVSSSPPAPRPRHLYPTYLSDYSIGHESEFTVGKILALKRGHEMTLCLFYAQEIFVIRIRQFYLQFAIDPADDIRQIKRTSLHSWSHLSKRSYCISCWWWKNAVSF